MWDRKRRDKRDFINSDIFEHTCITDEDTKSLIIKFSKQGARQPLKEVAEHKGEATVIYL